MEKALCVCVWGGRMMGKARRGEGDVAVGRDDGWVGTGAVAGGWRGEAAAAVGNLANCLVKAGRPAQVS